MDAVETPRFSWIGWDSAGKVDVIDSERIETEFFFVIVPVWPRRSYYSYRNRDGEECQFEIPRDRRSVFLGYTRTTLWFVASILATPAAIDFGRWKYFLVFAALLAGAAAVLTFGLGKLPPAERERREMLRRVAGIGAPPELMPPGMLANMRDDLADEWYHQAQVDWRDSIRRGEASETLVVLAEYHRDPRLAIRARTNLINFEGN